MRASVVDAGSMMTTAAAMSGIDRSEGIFPPGTTQDSQGMLPEVSNSQIMIKENVKIGYETHQVGGKEAVEGAENSVPRFGGPGNKRLTTGNGPVRPQQLQPLMALPSPHMGAQSVKHTSINVPQSDADGSGPNKINIIAKKRPPPMAIGFNEKGIDMTRQVLYRNFHMINEAVYLVEISRNPKKVFILLFPNFERPDEYLQELLTDKQATKLMSECGNIFENFIANFYVKFGRL